MPKRKLKKLPAKRKPKKPAPKRKAPEKFWIDKAIIRDWTKAAEGKKRSYDMELDAERAVSSNLRTQMVKLESFVDKVRDVIVAGGKFREVFERLAEAHRTVRPGFVYPDDDFEEMT